MVDIERDELEQSKKVCWQNVLACCTMPIEGVFFFGTILGWPNLVEIYKTLGVYEAKWKIN